MVSLTSPLYHEQPIVIFDTTQSNSSTSGSLVIYGGVSLSSTQDSLSVSSGNFVSYGGIGIAKSLNVGGNSNLTGQLRVTNTTQSLSVTTGAFQLTGGAGIGGNLNVGGNAVISGDLYVSGTTTYVNTQTIDLADNTLVLNAGPAGSRDAGLLIHRDIQDVIADGSVTSGSLASIEQTSFTLGGSFTGNYVGWWLRTTDGSAQVSTYNGTSGTFATSGNTLPLSPTDLNFNLYSKSYVGSFYDESADEYVLAYISDATDPKVDLSVNEYINLRLNTLLANTAVSTASLHVTSGATIANLALSSSSLSDATISNLTVTNSTVSSMFVTNSNVTNGTISNLVSTDSTVSNLTLTSGTISSMLVTNSNVTNSTLSNLVSSDSTVSNLTLTSGTVSSMLVTNSNVTNNTVSNLVSTDSSISNLQVSYATAGSVWINNNLDVLGNTVFDGNFTVTNGSILFNTVDVSPSLGDIIAERSSTIGNNVSSATNILNFSFNNSIARAFDAVVSVTINATAGNKYAYYNLKGIQKDTGVWMLNSSFVGDITGVTFMINNGSVQYISSNLPDFQNGIVKFRALTTSV